MSNTIDISTIGFTRKTARKFFELLRKSGVKRLIDVRLNNVSQLAGFAKRDDLEFFAKELCDVDYVHVTLLAPTQELLDSYKKDGGDWAEYEKRFLDLMSARKIEERLSPEELADGCLLCSEDKPHNCHRRLVAEYLRDRWSSPVAINHLV
jgi:uncharacterized protein (DUF488 family)